MSVETAVALAPVVPLIGAVLIWLAGSRPNLREAVTLITAGILFLLVLSVAPTVFDGGRPSVTLYEFLPGLSFAFEVEPAERCFRRIEVLRRNAYLLGQDVSRAVRVYSRSEGLSALAERIAEHIITELEQ